MSSVSFMMPNSSHVPIGGYKVVYEYANRFADAGYDVTILYPLTMDFRSESMMYKIKTLPRLVKWLIKGWSGRKWFDLRPAVKEKIVASLTWRCVPKSDYYVATALHTSFYLKNYPISPANKLYLIQGFENWNDSDTKVYESYNYGFKNIVISKWLKEKVEYAGAKCELIHNGFDFNQFRITKPIDKRNPCSLTMLFHEAEIKGTKYGLKAIEIARQSIPNIVANMFGVNPRPADLPEWINYTQLPDKEKLVNIYNSAAIFVAPSIEEGWGLTVGEAMICGCAVVATDADCFKEMVINGKTGLVSRVKDADEMAKNIIKLINDNEFRQQIAQTGNQHIKQFTWESSFAKFKKLHGSN